MFEKTEIGVKATYQVPYPVHALSRLVDLVLARLYRPVVDVYAMHMDSPTTETYSMLYGLHIHLADIEGQTKFIYHVLSLTEKLVNDACIISNDTYIIDKPCVTNLAPPLVVIGKCINRTEICISNDLAIKVTYRQATALLGIEQGLTLRYLLHYLQR